MEITQGKGKILAILITGGRLGYRIMIGGDVQLLVEFELLEGLLLTSSWPAELCIDYNDFTTECVRVRDQNCLSICQVDKK